MCLILLSAGIFGARLTDRMFPVFPIVVLVIVLFLVPLIFRVDKAGKNRFYTILLLLIFFAVSIRLLIFTFPASMIAFDPDTFAISIQSIISNGSTAGIRSNFYREAPLFHIFTAVYSQIALVRAADAMAIWPIIVGTLFTLSAVIFALYLSQNLKSALAAGVLMAILSNSVTFSYTPIPNLMAAALFLPAIICLVYLFKGQRMHLIPVNIIFISLIFTHKLHPLITVCIVFIALFLTYSQRIFSSGHRSFYFVQNTEILILFGIFTIMWAVVVQMGVPSLLLPGAVVFGASVYRLRFDQKAPQMDSSHILSINQKYENLFWKLLLLFGVILAIQWVFLTNLLYSVVVYRILPLTNQPEINTNTQLNFNYIDPIDYGIRDVFFHQADVLILVLPMSLAWVYLFYTRGNSTSLVLLAASGVGLSLIPTGIFAGTSGGLGAQRALLVFSPLGIAVISAFIFDNSKNVMKAAFIIIVIIQVFSGGFVPDDPNSYRKYLTEDEISAKEFSLEYTSGDIYTDQFYASESILPVTSRGEDVDMSGSLSTSVRFKSFGTDLLQKNISGGKYQRVILRNDINPVRTGIGTVRLTWDPEQTFKKDTNYSRVYDTGSVSHYTHTS